MLRRSQTTSSHIKVISKNSSSASFGRFVKLHHESAKKREEARGYSTRVGAEGWPVDPRHPVYSRGRGGHEIFLRLPRNATAAASSLCYISKKPPFFNDFKLLAPGGIESEKARGALDPACGDR
jgi:hypothetical protein